MMNQSLVYENKSIISLTASPDLDESSSSVDVQLQVFSQLKTTHGRLQDTSTTITDSYYSPNNEQGNELVLDNLISLLRTSFDVELDGGLNVHTIWSQSIVEFARKCITLRSCSNAGGLQITANIHLMSDGHGFLASKSIRDEDLELLKHYNGASYVTAGDDNNKLNLSGSLSSHGNGELVSVSLKLNLDLFVRDVEGQLTKVNARGIEWQFWERLDNLHQVSVMYLPRLLSLELFQWVKFSKSWCGDITEFASMLCDEARRRSDVGAVGLVVGFQTVFDDALDSYVVSGDESFEGEDRQVHDGDNFGCVDEDDEDGYFIVSDDECQGATQTGRSSISSNVRSWVHNQYEVLRKGEDDGDNDYIRCDKGDDRDEDDESDDEADQVEEEELD